MYFMCWASNLANAVPKQNRPFKGIGVSSCARLVVAALDDGTTNTRQGHWDLACTYL